MKRNAFLLKKNFLTEGKFFIGYSSKRSDNCLSVPVVKLTDLLYECSIIPIKMKNMLFVLYYKNMNTFLFF
jgi:hypothetical protein